MSEERSWADEAVALGREAEKRPDERAPGKQPRRARGVSGRFLLAMATAVVVIVGIAFAGNGGGADQPSTEAGGPTRQSVGPSPIGTAAEDRHQAHRLKVQKAPRRPERRGRRHRRDGSKSKAIPPRTEQPEAEEAPAYEAAPEYVPEPEPAAAPPPPPAPAPAAETPPSVEFGM